jgi:hypothetical protein
MASEYMLPPSVEVTVFVSMLYEIAASADQGATVSAKMSVKRSIVAIACQKARFLQSIYLRERDYATLSKT